MSTVSVIPVTPIELRSGEARALRLVGLAPQETIVFLDAKDEVSRVREGGRETVHPSWAVQQVLRDVLDPHELSDG